MIRTKILKGTDDIGDSIAPFADRGAWNDNVSSADSLPHVKIKQQIPHDTRTRANI